VGRGSVRTCRFGFPRRPAPTFKINPVKKCVRGRCAGRRVDLVEVPRGEHERNINPYNREKPVNLRFQ
jgi:hypothetical protein